jgi:hypothetical protein
MKEMEERIRDLEYEKEGRKEEGKLNLYIKGF